MGETIGIGIAVLVISSFILCMIIFFVSWGIKYNKEFDNYHYQNDFKVKPTVRKLTDKEIEEAKAYSIIADNDKQTKAKDTTFVITNIKESVVKTEVVYAD